MANKIGLSRKSLAAATKVVKTLSAYKIVKVHTQAAMYRMIEVAKFGEVGGTHYSKNNTRNIFAGFQYDAILNYLMFELNVLVKAKEKNKYAYYINKPILKNLMAKLTDPSKILPKSDVRVTFCPQHKYRYRYAK